MTYKVVLQRTTLSYKNTYTIPWNWIIPEKIQTRGNWNFKCVLLHLEILEKTSFHPWKFCKIVWHPVEVARSKTKTHGNSTWVFLEHLWNIHYHTLSPMTLEVPCPQPPCLEFFWNSLFEVVFILSFAFAVLCCRGATVTLQFHDLVLTFFYSFCFQMVFT